MPIRYESSPLNMAVLRSRWNDADLPTSRLIATIPNTSILSVCRVHIKTPFNATGTDLLRIGIGAGGSSLGINLDVSQPAGTIIDRIGAAITSSPQTANREIFATYAFTGTAPTAGDMLIELGWYI